MANTTSILSTDLVSDSRSVINNNFAQKYIAYKSSSSSVINSVLVADESLSFPIQANEIWNIKGALVYTSATVADLKFMHTAPVGAVGYIKVDDSAGTATLLSSVINVSGSGSAAFAGSNGIFINGPVAGSVDFYWAQQTNTDSSVTTLLQGSNIIATKLN